MINAIKQYLPESYKGSPSEGGMFLWVEGPKGVDMEKLYFKALKRKVAFVPGKFFFTKKDEGMETMRLNYTMSDEKTIGRAIKTLGKVIQDW